MVVLDILYSTEAHAGLGPILSQDLDLLFLEISGQERPEMKNCTEIYYIYICMCVFLWISTSNETHYLARFKSF